MDVSWDADNFEPKLPTTLTSSNKWEGEDEEETVKESWEDEEEEEKKDEEKKEVPALSVKPKKKIAEKIAEKERLEREKAERLAAERAEAEMTPEQRLAEKLRQQKLQEESDLRLALETFGVNESGGGKLDSFHPTNKAEFTEFAELLSKKISYYKSKDEFPGFIEELFRNIVANMQSADIKRIKMSVDNLYIEKQKAEKNDKGKKPAKGKGKAKLKLDSDNAHLNPEAYGTFDDDYDDFM